MEEIHTIKKHQHHSKIAIYAIVGFLVVITLAVILISQRVQQEQAYQVPSQASETDNGQRAYQSQEQTAIAPQGGLGCGAVCGSNNDCGISRGLKCDRKPGSTDAKKYCIVEQCLYGGTLGADGCTCYGGSKCYQPCATDDQCDPGMKCGPDAGCDPRTGICEDVFRCYDPNNPQDSTCSNVVTSVGPGGNYPGGDGGGSGGRLNCPPGTVQVCVTGTILGKGSCSCQPVPTATPAQGRGIPPTATPGIRP